MDEDSPKSRRHPNRETKRSMKSSEVATFVRRYGRTSRRDGDPNDRKHDHDLEQRLKQMDPVDLDRLMRDDED